MVSVPEAVVRIEALIGLLDSGKHRAAARRVQQEIGAMPGPEQTVALIEEYQRAVGRHFA